MADWARSSMDRIIGNVVERADSMRTFIRAQDVGIPLGQESVTDEEWLRAFDAEERKSPPQMWQDKATGARFFASAFTLALSMPNVDGGKEILDRARKLRSASGN